MLSGVRALSDICGQVLGNNEERYVREYMRSMCLECRLHAGVALEVVSKAAVHGLNNTCEPIHGAKAHELASAQVPSFSSSSKDNSLINAQHRGDGMWHLCTPTHHGALLG